MSQRLCTCKYDSVERSVEPSKERVIATLFKVFLRAQYPTIIGPMSRRTSSDSDSSDELCRFYSCLQKTYIAKLFGTFGYFFEQYCFAHQGYSVLTKVSSHARRNQFAPDITQRKSDVTSLLTSLCIQTEKVFAREYSRVFRKTYTAKIIATSKYFY